MRYEVKDGPIVLEQSFVNPSLNKSAILFEK